MNKIKKGDEVVVIAGKDKGKRGLVIKVMMAKDKLVVENINMAKRHTRGDPMRGTPGGIVEKEMPIEISNVAIWNPVTNKPDRIGFRFLEDGKKVRYFKSDNEIVDV